MAKGATSKKKKEDENRQESQQRQTTPQREETRQRQQRTQQNVDRSQSQPRNDRANSRQTTRTREVAPQAIPVLEERSTPRRSASGRNVSEMFPEYEPQQAAAIPTVQPIPTNNRGQGFQADLDQRMRDYYNNGTPIARNGQGFRPDVEERIKASDASQYGTERAEEPQMEEYPSAAEKGRKDAQRREESQAKSATAQRSELEEDIAKLAQINTGSVMGVSANPDMLAKGVTGQTLDDYYAYLEDKYHFNRDELDDLALSYKSELNNEQSAKLAQKAAKFGEEHPVLGSAASLPVTLAGAVEGLNNVLVGGLTGDERRLSRMASGTKQGFREGAQENIDSKGGKIAYNLGMGLGDLAIGAATGQAPAILAGNTANEATLSAVDRGQSVRKSALYGAGSGVLDYITNTIGLDKAKALGMNKIASGGIVGLLKRAGVAAATEAGENLIQDLGQTFLDELINGEKSEIRTAFAQRIESGESVEQAIQETALDWVKDRGMSLATGAVMGAGMYGGTMGARGVRNGVRALANKAATYGALGDNSANVWKAVNDAEYQRSQQLNPVDMAAQNEIDVPKVEAEQAQALDAIQKLNEQVPDITDQNVNPADSQPVSANEITNPDVNSSNMDFGHQIAEKYAAAFDAYDPYEAMDNADVVDGFVEQMARDINEGNDLSSYMEDIRANMQNADPEARVAMESVFDELRRANAINHGYNYDYSGVDVEYNDDFVEPERLISSLTGKTVSPEFAAAVRKLESGQMIEPEEYDAIPEVIEARERVGDVRANSTHLIPSYDADGNLTERGRKRLQWLEDLKTKTGSATLDAKGKVVYNGVVNRGKRADIILGLPSSGKSSAIVDPISYKYKSRLIDSDEAKKLIDEYDDGWGSGRVHEESTEINDDLLAYALNNDENVVIPKVGGSYGEWDPETQSFDGIKGLIDLLKENKYEVYVHFNDLDPAKAAGRNMRRFANVGRFLDLRPTSFKYKNHPQEVFNRIVKEGEIDGYTNVSNDVRKGESPVQLEGTEDISFDWRNDRALRGENGAVSPGEIAEAPSAESGDNSNNQINIPEGQPTSEAASSFTEGGVNSSENGGEVPANPVNTPSPEMGQRRAFTNTGVKSGIVDPWDIQNNPVTKKDVEYVKHKNAETLSNATENVAKYHDMLAEQYASGTRKVNQDQDLDQAMLILGDERTSRWTFDSIMRNLATHATEAGQFIQAFAKWANTSIGAIAKATTIDANTVKKWESRNRRAVRANEDLSAKLKQAIDTITDYSDRAPDDPQTLAVIRQQVANTIDAYKNTWIRDIRKTNMVMGEGDFNFTDSDIDYLAHMLDHGATVNELKDALNMKVATNRFGISTETQDKVNRLFQYAQEFDEDSREFCEAQAEAFRLLAEEVAPKASALEKFDAWRYIAMLGNPKTMLRNYVGNKLFSAVTGVSNNLAAAMEHGANWIVKGVGKAELNSIPRLQNKIADLQRSMYNSANPERTQRRIDALQQKVDQRAENAIEHSNGIQRTKEFLNPIKDRDLIEGAENFAKNTAWRDVEGSKYERINQDSLKNNRSVFDSDLMRIVEKAVNEGISDTNAVLKKFSTSMAGYMKANGLDASAFEDAYRFRQLERDSRVRLLSGEESYEMESLRETANLMDKAREYALKQAEYATFHEDNKIADVLSSWSRASRNKGIGLGSMIIEGTVPFKKTPANILRSGVEYSPFGAIKSVAELGKLVIENTGKNKGNLADEYKITNPITGKEHNVRRTLASDVIDSWSKTLTGSALAYLGYYLFNKGVITSSEKGTKYQDQLEGIGNYAININGHTFTLDWAAPGVMPLLLGAEVNKVLKSNGMLDEEWYSNPDQWIRTLNALLNPILETSMMSGVKDTLTEVANQTRYGEDESIPGGIIGSLVGNTLLGYASQAIPTLSGQIARTIDPIRRTTDTKSGQAAISALEKQGRKALNKLPFLSMLNPEYRDAYGQRQYNSPYQYEEGNPLANIRAFEGNLVYQMLSPSYYSKQNTTNADLLGRDLYNATDEEGNTIPGVTNDDSVFATWRASKTINGAKLDPYQLQTFREEMGQANKALREELYNSEWYNNLPEIAQHDIVNGLNTIADKIGQYAVMPDSVNVSGALKTYLDAGGGEEGIQAIIDELEAENNIYGLGKDQYSEKKASGEDLTPYEGFGEAIGAYGANDNQNYEDAYLSGGTPAVAMENRYQNTLKDLELSDSNEVRSAWTYGGRQGVQKVVDYRNALEEMGLTDNQTNKAAYDEGGIEALKPIAEYNHAFENAGMDTAYTSESAKEAYEDKDLDTYKDYREYLKGIGQDDSMDRWEEFKENGNIDGITDDIVKLHGTMDWDSLGIQDSVYTTQRYQRAVTEIPTLTPEKFATTYNEMDGMDNSNNTITQAELIAYLNKHGIKASEGLELWNAYLTNPTDKTIPVLKGGTWSAKRK